MMIIMQSDNRVHMKEEQKGCYGRVLKDHSIPELIPSEIFLQNSSSKYIVLSTFPAQAAFHMGPSWAKLGPIWAPFGPLLGPFGNSAWVPGT